MDASDLTPTVADAIQPNGLCFSPDEKRLYIADSGAKPGLVRVYDVDGKTLNNPRIFCEIDAGVPDGMRCDAQGRLWAGCGDGVQVFAPDGTRLGRVLTPTPVTNCCFGGERGDDLYLTASTTLYRIKTTTTGSTSHQLPK